MNVRVGFLAVAVALLAVEAFAERPISPADLITLAGGKQNIYVYLLAGQSNMSGRGLVVDHQFDDNPRVAVFAPLSKYSHNKPGWFIAPHEPLHRATDPQAGVGPGLAFAWHMSQAYPDAIIALVPVGFMGTCLDAWLPGTGKDFDIAAEWFSKALEVGTPRGIVWVQGECDSAFVPLAKRYPERILRIFSAFRRIAGSTIPVVVAETPDFPGAAAKQLPGKDDVRRTLLALYSNQANTGFASSENLEMRDGVHYSSKGQYELAERLSIAMIILEVR